MALKRLWVDIQHDLMDMWDIKSAMAEKFYNEYRGDFDYLLVINKDSVTTNIRDKVYVFTTEEERDEMLFKIKDSLSASPNMYFLGETDGHIDDEDVDRDYRNRKKEKYDDKDPDEDDDPNEN